jgi:hypothetical protein
MAKFNVVMDEKPVVVQTSVGSSLIIQEGQGVKIKLWNPIRTIIEGAPIPVSVYPGPPPFIVKPALLALFSRSLAPNKA